MKGASYMKRVFCSFLILFVCVFGILGYRMQLEIMEMERPRLLTLAETEEEILPKRERYT